MCAASVWLAVTVAFWAVSPAQAQQQVAATVHNLSASGPGEIRALEETEICKFCHIPHNTETAEALWSQRLSDVQYRTPVLKTGSAAGTLAPQPDGSSRLCLSCHDGTVALGDIAGEPSVIPMRGSQQLAAGRPGHLGTDLSGSHPVSFVMPNGDPDLADTGRDMGLRSLGAVQAAPWKILDDLGKVQCTSCHDPHDDSFHVPGQVPRFWVAQTVEEVCITCHAMR